MTEAKPASDRKAEVDRGPLGDARPKDKAVDPRTGGSLPQEDVEDRDNVSTVTPEDYPAKDREIANPARKPDGR